MNNETLRRHLDPVANDPVITKLEARIDVTDLGGWLTTKGNVVFVFIDHTDELTADDQNRITDEIDNLVDGLDLDEQVISIGWNPTVGE